MKSWLQLLRAPNLFTVPGDPLAGFIVAYGAVNGGKAYLDQRVVFAVIAALCLYCAGLIMNDLFDLDEDRRDRPDRPLASGAIPVRSAWIMASLLSVAGVVAMHTVAGQAGFTAALALLGCVGLYNGVTKHIPVIGAINMGLCRGLSVLLGAVAFSNTFWPHPGPVLLAATVVTLYIAAVTNLARHETKDRAPAFARVLPALVATGVFLLFHAGHGPIIQRPATTLLAVCLVFVAAEVGRLFRKDPPPLPPVIGALIRVLLPLQAALCIMFPFAPAVQYTAAALVLLMPVARIVGQRFYAS